jgi:hypothetical protein
MDDDRKGDDIDLDDLAELDAEPEIENPEEDAELQEQLSRDDDQPAPRKSRGNRHFSELRRENRDLRDQIQRLSGSVETLTRAPRVDNERERMAEQERIANMTDREYAQYMIDKERSQISQAFQAQNFQMADQTDSLKFERLCDRNEVYAKIADEVEDRLLSLRAKGQTVERRTLANLILGEKAAARTSRPARQPQDRKVRGGAASDVAQEERTTRKGKTAKDRLANITF